ncbi:hypothetical protein B0H11DRAFT_2194445 [Mycena galericulata]|nr:hypothetical protein B0H11DRAFT_2194445 [Mycena galericulata]
MPPGSRRKASGQAPTPAAAPANDPAAGPRSTRSSRRNAVPAEAEPPFPPRRVTRKMLLDSLRYIAARSKQMYNQIFSSTFELRQFAAPFQNVQPVPQTPIRSRTTPLQIPQPPGQAAANRRLSRLNQKTQMASPASPILNHSDDESDSGAVLPRILTVLRLLPAALALETGMALPSLEI